MGCRFVFDQGAGVLVGWFLVFGLVLSGVLFFCPYFFGRLGLGLDLDLGWEGGL